MVRGIWRSVPHVILRAPTVVNLGMTLIILGGAAILYHATTDFVGGTLAPGVGVGGVTGTLLWTDVDLTDAVSILLMAWILILMAQLFLAGPSIDRSRRLRAAQGTAPASQPPAISRRSIMTGGALVAVSGAVILEAAEVVTSAPPLLFWYATLPGAVVVGALVSLVVSFLDRGLRHLEADLTYLPVPPDDEPSPT